MIYFKFILAAVLGIAGGVAVVASVTSPEACTCSAVCPCGCKKGLPCICKNRPKANCSDHCKCGCAWPTRNKCTCSKADTPAKIVKTPTDVVPNYGVDTDKLNPEGGCTRKGKPCSKDEAIKAIQKSIPDDSQKLRLTVIGSEARRSEVLKDLKSHPSLTPHMVKFVVQMYSPSDWAVSRYGFKTDGDPTIYIQRPDGKVVHRQDSYQGGAERLATALRKADPSYDPAKDPDLTKPTPSPPSPIPLPFEPGKIPTEWWYAAGAFAVAWFLFSNKKGDK